MSDDAAREAARAAEEAALIEEGRLLFARPWTFLRGAPALAALPAETGPEIAFAGRSNVGKSSLINALTGQRGLARTSNTPGRTQELNFFAGKDAELTIVDMPGYGYAEAPKKTVDTWTRLIHDYLRGRRTLARVFVLIDARHGIKGSDVPVMETLNRSAVSWQGVLTKADKIGPRQLAEVIEATDLALRKHPAAFPELIVTSSETGAGMERLKATIALLVRQAGPRPVA